MEADSRDMEQQIRAALIEAALSAYEDASLQGVCAEGAWEVAVAAMRALDLSAIVSRETTPRRS